MVEQQAPYCFGLVVAVLEEGALTGHARLDGGLRTVERREHAVSGRGDERGSVGDERGERQGLMCIKPAGGLGVAVIELVEAHPRD